MRNSITEALDSVEDSSGPDFKVVLAGLSNVYTHYIATFEEYQRQRYEAASTIFGPHSLQAYQQQYAKLADTMLRVSGSVVMQRSSQFKNVYEILCRETLLTRDPHPKTCQTNRCHLCRGLCMTTHLWDTRSETAPYSHPHKSSQGKPS